MADALFTVNGMLIDGEWVTTGSGGETRVLSPYDGSVVVTVPAAGKPEVDRAVRAARAALGRDDFPRHERVRILEQAAAVISDRKEEFARAIAAECAKPIRTARVEAGRAVETFAFAAAEARRFAGELVPMEATPSGAGKTGLALRVPVGVVAAISPFNFPLNLVAHKVAPAIAAGCPLVLKPASQTPLSALMLAELLHGFGVPAGWVNVVTGGGRAVGDPLVEHPDVAYITFTGSASVGWGIAAKAPKKKVRLELGSNSPLLVESDGDWRTAATKTATAGFSHAGQSCISTQRVYVHDDIVDDFLDELLSKVEALRLGDPMRDDTDVSSLISTGDTERVKSWVDEAVAEGAKVVCGGEIATDLGAGVLRPTVVTDTTRDMKLQSQEVFGPVITVTRYRDFDDALAMANDSVYGLQAGVYTSDLGKALRAARLLEYGGVAVNEVPTARADQQPYGGVKESGNTREGPAYAVREMTELRFVSLQP